MCFIKRRFVKGAFAGFEKATPVLLCAANVVPVFAYGTMKPAARMIQRAVFILRLAVPRAPNPLLQRKIARDKPFCRNLGAQLQNNGANPRENGAFSPGARLTNDVFVGILILIIVTGSDREE